MPVDIEVLDIDNAVYQLIARAARFDVIVSSNMFGDVLADCGALLLGSRGMSYSGNFGEAGRAVYQTGHGAAYDIAGTGKANPAGQILSAAMMLEESFGWIEGARCVRKSLDRVLGPRDPHGRRRRDRAQGRRHEGIRRRRVRCRSPRLGIAACDRRSSSSTCSAITSTAPGSCPASRSFFAALPRCSKAAAAPACRCSTP